MYFSVHWILGLDLDVFHISVEVFLAENGVEAVISARFHGQFIGLLAIGCLYRFGDDLRAVAGYQKWEFSEARMLKDLLKVWNAKCVVHDLADLLL